MGYSRQQFYAIRRNYQTYGAEGLMDRLPGARGPHPNRVSEKLEAAILAHALDHPTHGCARTEPGPLPIRLRLRALRAHGLVTFVAGLSRASSERSAWRRTLRKC